MTLPTSRHQQTKHNYMRTSLDSTDTLRTRLPLGDGGLCHVNHFSQLVTLKTATLRRLNFSPHAWTHSFTDFFLCYRNPNRKKWCRISGAWWFHTKLDCTYHQCVLAVSSCAWFPPRLSSFVFWRLWRCAFSFRPSWNVLPHAGT